MVGRLRTMSLVFVITLVLAPVLALLHVTEPDLLADLTYEDGVVEYLQAFLYLGAAIAFAIVAWRTRAKSWETLLAVGMFFIAGEEISWGQRILGISTPASLEERNVQGEFNLHNIEGVHGSIRAVGLMVVIVMWIVVPLAHRWMPAARRFLDRVRAPEVPLLAVPLALVALAYMVVPRILTGVVFALDEVGELYLALAAFAFGLHAVSPVVERPVPTIPAQAPLAERPVPADRA